MYPVQILADIADQVSKCEKCALHFSRKNAVPGEGPFNSELMFIGEGPGFYENEQGRPFVGQAGKFLDELLEEAGYDRDKVFIANVVKCRPPGNRDPLPEELLACSYYLDKQIEVINPCVIVTLGRISMSKFLPYGRISEIHGKPAWVSDRLIVPMYHPAAALHQPSLKPVLMEDFRNLPKAIQQSRSAGRITSMSVEPKNIIDIAEEPPEQLSLF
ncbi:MAG TPA: uracil-DNA glycosylase [Anaerolineaceae bacterium]|nr:uracil-DNA glycosylase [Anaerolineaceae bacterium]